MIFIILYFEDILNKRIEEQRQKQLERQAQTNKNKATLSGR